MRFQPNVHLGFKHKPNIEITNKFDCYFKVFIRNCMQKWKNVFGRKCYRIYLSREWTLHRIGLLCYHLVLFVQRNTEIVCISSLFPVHQFKAFYFQYAMKMSFIVFVRYQALYSWWAKNAHKRLKIKIMTEIIVIIRIHQVLCCAMLKWEREADAYMLTCFCSVHAKRNGVHSARSTHSYQSCLSISVFE